MSGTDRTERDNPDKQVTEHARDSLAQAEAGNRSALRQLDEDRKTDSAGVQAVEQEASDGPEGLGLAR